MVAWPRWSAEVAGGGRGGGVVGSGKGLEVVEGVVGVEEALSLPSPWAETSREGGSMEASGGQPWSLAWRRCVAWARARGGGGGCEDAGRRGGLFVGAARRWRGGAALVAVRRARRCALMAFGRYRGVVERRHGRRGGHRTTRRLGQARAARRAPEAHRDVRGRGAERVRGESPGHAERVRAWSRRCACCAARRTAWRGGQATRRVGERRGERRVRVVRVERVTRAGDP